MKYRSIMLSEKWCLILLIVFLCGCSPTYLKEHCEEWVSRPLSELKQTMKSPDSYASKIGWKETTYQLANGNSVYIEPFDSDCFIHWEVTPKRGIIVGYRVVGSGCGQELSSDNSSALQKMTTPAPATKW